ncbi:tetratricopeptide repeat protein [Aquipseudomonas alcaligenes]|uniref:Sel1 repeat family protein n=1 Tax=Aquipseudomonas alcaligenes TaxID=43263 RepID=A0AB73HX19_AQUAC|nr:hypothetical protein [Pseudomonas alcaligenes]MDH0142393.1 hypothetical protein [Pseudomonas alcaligenes]
MHGWGLTLMIVGGLSFILPMFGRQFILVTALGLTGAGAFLSGIILFIIGLALYIISQNKEEASSHPSPNILMPVKNTAPQNQESNNKSQEITINEEIFSRADAGDIGAQMLIGTAYLAGGNGLPRDPAKGVKYLKMVAEHGSPDAAMFVSAIHIDKSFGIINLDEANFWAEKAESLGADTALLLQEIEKLRQELNQIEQHKELVNLLVTRKGFTPEQADLAINRKISSLKEELQGKGLPENEALNSARDAVYKISNS